MGKGQDQEDGQGEGHEAGFGQGIKDSLAICGTYCDLIALLIYVLALIGLGIAKIVMGAIYINDCPIQYLIPIWLIVSSCAPLLVLVFFKMANSSNVIHAELEEPTIKQIFYHELAAIGNLFIFAWFICGTVWIAQIYSTVKDGCPGSTSCCNVTLMDFALAMLMIDWVFTGLVIVLRVVSCVALCFGKVVLVELLIWGICQTGLSKLSELLQL